MSGWVRLDFDFASHRKALALCGELGDPLADAYMARLWAWAGQGSVEGEVIGAHADMMIEVAVRWSGPRGALVRVMVDLGILDLVPGGFRVHGFWEANGAQLEKSFKDIERKRAAKALADGLRPQPRARTARDKRAPDARTASVSSASNAGDVTRRDVTIQDRKDLEATALSASADAALAAFGPSDLAALWNANAAPDLPRASKVAGERLRAAAARAKENPDPAFWLAAIQRINRSPGCLGKAPGKDGQKPWRADFDWLVKPLSAARVMEGKYDGWGASAVQAAPVFVAPGEDLYPDMEPLND